MTVFHKLKVATKILLAVFAAQVAIAVLGVALINHMHSLLTAGGPPGASAPARASSPAPARPPTFTLAAISTPGAAGPALRRPPPARPAAQQSVRAQPVAERDDDAPRLWISALLVASIGYGLLLVWSLDGAAATAGAADAANPAPARARTPAAQCAPPASAPLHALAQAGPAARPETLRIDADEWEVEHES